MNEERKQLMGPMEAASCWSCWQGRPVDWGEMVMLKAIEDIWEGRVAPGEIHWVARWRTGGMRYGDMERVGVALEEGGWVRYLGQGRVQILAIDATTPSDPETRREPADE